MNIPNCVYCNTVIESSQPVSMLLCDHIAHTYCLLRELTVNDRHSRCTGCTNYIIPDQLIFEVNQPEPQTVTGPTNGITTTIVEQLFNTNTQFKKDAKIIQEQCITIHKALRPALKVRNQKRKEFKASLSDIKVIVRTRRRDMKQAIKNSPECKTYVREMNKLKALHKKFKTTYDILPVRLPTLLESKRGFKNWPRVRMYTSFLYRDYRIRV